MVKRLVENCKQQDNLGLKEKYDIEANVFKTVKEELK